MSQCRECRYYRGLKQSNDPNKACHFLLDEGFSRPCKDPEECELWKLPGTKRNRKAFRVALERKKDVESIHTRRV